MRVVQALQDRLRQTQQELQEAERAAKGLQAVVEDCSFQGDAISSRQHQLVSALQSAQRKRLEDQALQDTLLAQIEACQAELAAAREHRESLVPPAEHSAMKEELGCTLARLEETEEEGRDLRTRLAEAEASQRRRDRSLAMQAREEAERRRAPRNPREALLNKAAELSARVAAERQFRQRPRSQERLVHLDGQREQLSQELRRLCRQNVVLEQRLESLRVRNRQLEGQQRRAAEARDMQERALRAELRRRAAPLRVLTELVRDDHGERLAASPRGNLREIGGMSE